MVNVLAASLLLATLASANPVLYARQDASSVLASASGASASASAILSSGLASASGLASSHSASASASAAAGAAAYPGYPCPQGLLTYVEVNQTYPGISLEQAVSFLENWSKAVPYPIVNSTGTNTTGATRTYTVQGLNVSEVLVNQTINSVTGQLNSDWNLTSPISTNGLTIYSAADHLSYYTNTTTGISTADIYSNFCASDQAAGAAAFTALFQSTLKAIGAALAASGASSALSASAGGAVPPRSSSASSAASALSSASGALSSATASA